MSETILDRLRNGLVRTTRQSIEVLCLHSSLTAGTTELSSTSDDPKKLSDADRIDRKLMAHLIHRKIINWCDKTCKLAPLKNDQTSVSGLLRAVASSIWGQHDEATDSFLQRLLHVALTTGKQQPAFKERWRLERELEKASALSDAPHHSRVSWEDVYSTFQGNELQTEEEVLLDPIHLFSLSNILRRPIIVLGDISPASSSRSSARDLTGIYLPLLSSAESCVPYPLVLVRYSGLFRALLVNRVSLEWWQVQSFRSVPLVKVDQEPIHIRCLLTSENRRVRDLLLSYLNIAEISHTTPSGTFQVLTCRLSTERPLLERPEREDIWENAAQNRMTPFSESCLVTDEVSSDTEEGLRLTGVASKMEVSGCARNCIACQTIRRAEQKRLKSSRPQSESDVRPLRRTYSTRCENVRCRKEGSQKYGGRCYACYVTKDPWFEGVSYNGDEPLRNSLEDPVCPKLDKMQELTVEDSMRDSRKGNGSSRQKHRNVEAEFKDMEMLSKVMDIPESANFKHRHESEIGTDRSDSAAVAFSTAGLDVGDITKTNGKAKISNLQMSENATRIGDPVKFSDSNESVAVGNTHETTYGPMSPQRVDNKACQLDEIDPASGSAAITKTPAAEKLLTSEKDQDLKGALAERQSCAAGKCIVDFCDNTAENAYRGLCKSCYLTLVRHRAPTADKEEQVVRPNPVSTAADIQCLMEGCEGPTINQQLGLCLPCLRMQIFAARDLERMKAQRRSLRQHSDTLNRTTKVGTSTIALPDDRSSRTKKQGIFKSPSDPHAAQVRPSPTLDRRRSALKHPSPRRTKAKCCLTPDCDRYGDPGFDGYCSLCYERLSPELLVPRS